MEQFFENQERLLEEIVTEKRYLYEKVDFSERLIGVVGARGVGKTTLLLQYLSTQKKDFQSLYISADNIYFLENNLLEFARDFYLKNEGKILIIDEVHKVKNWSQILKNIYDSFPKLQVIFSGSSSLDLKAGNYDLSRRASVYHLEGFSLREYINFTYKKELPVLSYTDILKNYYEKSIELSEGIPILKYFKEYLESEDFEPQVLINYLNSGELSTELQGLYYGDVGVKEGYNLANHTNMVAHQLEKVISPTGALPEHVSKDFMRLLVALHDIGKPNAVEAAGGNEGYREKRKESDEQHDFTKEILDTITPSLELPEDQKNMLYNLLSKDPIGKYVKKYATEELNLESDTQELLQVITDSAKGTGLSPQHYFDTILILYKSDASSYTWNAGGINNKRIEALFIFDNNTISFRDDIHTLMNNVRNKLSSDIS